MSNHEPAWPNSEPARTFDDAVAAGLLNRPYNFTVPDADHLGGVVNIPDRDYFLREGAGWFEYNGLVVRIFHDERNDGMEVSVYATGREDEEPLAQQFVSYQEGHR